ncbi:hypothetical protein NHP200010_15840 [Helicobacter bizzozeronii]|nr:hypothetical protein NHP200010_15840 [Helicobacter bizzozeronii]
MATIVKKFKDESEDMYAEPEFWDELKDKCRRPFRTYFGGNTDNPERKKAICMGITEVLTWAYMQICVPSGEIRRLVIAKKFC